MTNLPVEASQEVISLLESGFRNIDVPALDAADFADIGSWLTRFEQSIRLSERERAAAEGVPVTVDGEFIDSVAKYANAELERDFGALRRDYGGAAKLIEIMRERWSAVAAELDHIPGGMHADLEDAASNLATAMDDPKSVLATAIRSNHASTKGGGNGE